MSIDNDPREYRRGPTGLSHIRRETPIDARPFSQSNLILMRGGVATYCGRDASDWPVVADGEVHVCTRCDIAYFADDEAE